MTQYNQVLPKSYSMNAQSQHALQIFTLSGGYRKDWANREISLNTIGYTIEEALDYTCL